ncbi:Peptidoglycan/LPS O-acetylase OafA/YrhL, contains acyltransferase and SGNH-hydrolase domains [Roseivivax lentus]|uniref:Peptidoglycan/LPS O-acetylase OafA/YrhL, contains acyltransferase and SGNH-hydrolase domains n=1 Tax=Roseivivax lentus TaxID=633194 RepID=A0A1N7JTL8_9RHOB|nr:acyltransferase [Roseivivax lentus]SIS52576.1 Peptidoglycan/LPS O-acetylase OafA/YrhL, contains acyltransferase and SGNH-hydrolase domains [Roseivivax lentus]
MSRGFSLYLDALRFGAACLVLLSHWAYPRFTEGRHLWLRELNLGSDAVVVFFVLSGLVVAYAATEKDRASGRFAFQRLTRLWSVALPALVLGLALDRTGATLWPAAYDGWWYTPAGLGETLIRGLSFTSQWGGDMLRLGTNGPYWSLSYEAAFYLLFALWLWTSGMRRLVLIACAMVLIGPRILLLMPAWLMGVWLWHRIAAGNLPARTASLALAAGAPVLYAAALALGAPDALSAQSAALLGLPHMGSFGFSDEFAWNALLGLLVGAHLLGVAGLARGRSPGEGRAIRWLAGGSFSLYLVHYPVLQFLSPAMGARPGGLLGDLTLLAVTLAVCFVFAAAFERTLSAQRRLLRDVMPTSRKPGLTSGSTR